MADHVVEDLSDQEFAMLKMLEQAVRIASHAPVRVLLFMARYWYAQAEPGFAFSSFSYLLT